MAVPIFPGELTLKVEVDGDGEPECAGYVSASTAKKYYGAGEIVQVSAGAHSGYVFSHWKGTGKAWTSATSSGGIWSISGDGVDLEGMTASTVYVKMGSNDAGGYKPGNRELTAVYISRYAVLRVCSDTHWDMDATEFHGHAWIEVVFSCGGNEHSYGLYPASSDPSTDVVFDLDLSKTAVHDRYYVLTYDEWLSLDGYIESIGDDYYLSTFNCARFASACVLNSVGELLPYIDYRAGWVPTPRALSSSIKDKEEIRATSESDPLP